MEYRFFNVVCTDIWGNAIVKADVSAADSVEARVFLKQRLGIKPITTITRETPQFSKTKGEIKILMTTIYFADRFKKFYENEDNF